MGILNIDDGNQLTPDTHAYQGQVIVILIDRRLALKYGPDIPLWWPIFATYPLCHVLSRTYYPPWQ